MGSGVARRGAKGRAHRRLGGREVGVGGMGEDAATPAMAAAAGRELFARLVQLQMPSQLGVVGEAAVAPARAAASLVQFPARRVSIP